MSTEKPRVLYQSLSSVYPYETRSSAAGLIRENQDFSQKGFRYRARQIFNQVPAEIKEGTIQTVKKKLKKWVKQNIPID